MSKNNRVPEPMPLDNDLELAYSKSNPELLEEAPIGILERIKNWFFQEIPKEVEGERVWKRSVRPAQAQAVVGQQDVQLALANWKTSNAFFDQVSDPTLVDYAIYHMETTCKRYMYLLQNAQHQME